jgi:hypothetical protein
MAAHLAPWNSSLARLSARVVVHVPGYGTHRATLCSASAMRLLLLRPEARSLTTRSRERLQAPKERALCRSQLRTAPTGE